MGSPLRATHQILPKLQDAHNSEQNSAWSAQSGAARAHGDFLAGWNDGLHTYIIKYGLKVAKMHSVDTRNVALLSLRVFKKPCLPNVVMGQKPVSPVNIPISTKID